MIGSIDHFVDQQILALAGRAPDRGAQGRRRQRPAPDDLHLAPVRRARRRDGAHGRRAARLPLLLAGADPRHRRAGARPPAGGRVAGRTGAGRHRGVGRRADQARRVRAPRLPAQPVQGRADPGAPRQGRDHRPRRALPARCQGDAARARHRAARAACRAHRRSATACPRRTRKPRSLRIDGERVAFNRQHYNADIADPINYDLVVNAGTLGVEGAAEADHERIPVPFRRTG